MPLLELDDGNGETITVYEIDGYYHTDFPVPNLEKELRSMPTWNARDDDVIFAAYPKSGTHWIWEMAYLISRNKDTVLNRIKDIAMMENLHQERFDKIESPRVLNSHMYPRHLPQDFFKRRCKIVLLFRNPKDVAVSYYHHHHSLTPYKYHGQWSNYVNRFLTGKFDYGSWFDYIDIWESFMKENPDYPIHIMYYEDMIKDGMSELKKMVKFLEYDISEDYMKKIYDLCQFDNLKKEKDKIEKATDWRDGKPNMYRKGKVGDWKNVFTVAQSEMYDSVISKRLKDSKFKFTYELK